MKNNQLIDERVLNQQRKIISEAYILVIILLLGSMLVKQFILHLEPKEYLIEAIAFFGSSFYMLIRNILCGNNILFQSKSLNSNRKKLPLLNSINIGFWVTVSTVFLRKNEFSTTKDLILESILSFTSSTLVALLFFYTINKITNKRIKYIENKYDDKD
ncbi:DUF6773 family protein (plasmid) [Paraclostridium ghonii]|uniref:DUF6773 family protein n=1 Tax=Paraclostridium ghonii TaxID=29358 RepID=UPI00202CE1D9|nr:DUF6773 family protein [Paeniclostridium ghonii]MCM0165415.1 hypothetical protein [Paeniclostridium ghonii]